MTLAVCGPGSRVGLPDQRCASEPGDLDCRNGPRAVDGCARVFYRSFYRIPSVRWNGRGTPMKGYVTTKRGRYYAVIYEGLDPVTGRERRTWHPAGTDRAEAEQLAQRLAGECNGRNDEVRS